MFIGQYSSVLSSKRRVAIPGKFKTELGKRMIVARWYEECLVLIGQDNWQVLLKRLTGEAKVLTQAVRDTDRFILASAFEVEPDNQGRVVLPKILTDYAGLEQKVIFLGLGDRVEIWDSRKWEAKERAVSKEASRLIERYGNK